MGSVTTSRRTWPINPVMYTAKKGSITLQDYFPVGTMSQSTTSWRTGRSVPDVETAPSVDTPSTEAGVFKFLLDEAASRDTNPRNVYDTGHTFSTSRQSVIHLPIFESWGVRTTGATSYWKGAAWPFSFGVPGISLFPTASSAASLSNSRGAIAISSTAPNSPASTFGTGTGEILSDGTPRIIGSELKERVTFFRSLGSEYLNVEFGWLPFVADLKSTINAAINHHKILTQFQRDSGKPVRRAYYFRPDRSSQVIGTGAGSLMAPDLWSSGDWDASPSGRGLVNTSGSTYQLIRESTVESWFKGCFLYWIPDGDSYLDKVEAWLAKAQLLSGAALTPELVWQLAPWSWLVDWFSHLGRLFSLMTRFSSDGLVLKYGYMMFTTTVDYHHQIQNWAPGTGSGPGKYRSDVLITRTQLKERFRSTPYGFGVSSSSFTDHQWSILGALALLKSPKNLF